MLDGLEWHYRDARRAGMTLDGLEWPYRDARRAGMTLDGLEWPYRDARRAGMTLDGLEWPYRDARRAGMTLDGLEWPYRDARRAGMTLDGLEWPYRDPRRAGMTLDGLEWPYRDSRLSWCLQKHREVHTHSLETFRETNQTIQPIGGIEGGTRTTTAVRNEGTYWEVSVKSPINHRRNDGTDMNMCVNNVLYTTINSPWNEHITNCSSTRMHAILRYYSAKPEKKSIISLVNRRNTIMWCARVKFSWTWDLKHQ